MRPEPCVSWCVYDKGVCKFCGWPKDRSTVALTVWDNASGASREATQEDIDIMQAQVNAFARMMFDVAVIDSECKAQIRGIRERYARSRKLSGDA